MCTMEYDWVGTVAARIFVFSRSLEITPTFTDVPTLSSIHAFPFISRISGPARLKRLLDANRFGYSGYNGTSDDNSIYQPNEKSTDLPALFPRLGAPVYDLRRKGHL
jgi:hypothetical protein